MGFWGGGWWIGLLGGVRSGRGIWGGGIWKRWWRRMIWGFEEGGGKGGYIL